MRRAGPDFDAVLIRSPSSIQGGRCDAHTEGRETVVRLFEDESLDLVPVLVGKRMVGAVSRPGLVAALAPTSAPPIERPDADILADMKTHMAREVWISKRGPTVETCDGVVRLWGLVGGAAEKAALLTMARSIPGCRAVEDHLVVGAPIHRYPEMI